MTAGVKNGHIIYGSFIYIVKSGSKTTADICHIAICISRRQQSESSWPEDERVYAEWFDRHPEIKLVIAPHEFDKERLDTLVSLFKNGAVLGIPF